jgi:hypothetical protein
MVEHVIYKRTRVYGIAWFRIESEQDLDVVLPECYIHGTSIKVNVDKPASLLSS